MVELFLHLQSYTTETINKRTGEIQKINETFSKYEANIAITKNAKALFSTQLNEIERQCWAKAQYSRRECIEIEVTLSSVEKGNLESKVCEIFDKIGVTVTENDIETCHRLKGDETIVTFCKRKTYQNVPHKKRSLKNAKPSDVGLSGEKLSVY